MLCFFFSLAALAFLSSPTCLPRQMNIPHGLELSQRQRQRQLCQVFRHQVRRSESRKCLLWTRDANLQFLLRLDENYIVFRGNEHESASAHLTGTLVFCVTEPLTIKHVRLTLSGISRIRYARSFFLSANIAFWPAARQHDSRTLNIPSLFHLTAES